MSKKEIKLKFYHDNKIWKIIKNNQINSNNYCLKNNRFGKII